ncbi:Hsp33 family molecular chaperone HslO [Wenzhouxiangella limi]|uniref:Hsp33 family molecular chaperone HslO n=1 Tax=Wenzhouxiangella limi TaxID=2707351 RepID=A0A845VBN1_9GAMM|nr:Hsp33 family molecular chaperone HslO [Wenzhouxiangella limi]NDY94699.1 Hsp33 family molecular chaperone HslO [Wenzhouxiangella limi]
MVYKDYLQGILFEEIGARCVFVRLERVVEEVLARGDYASDEARLLGEALLVVALMSSGLKFSGRISLQLRGPGPLKLLLADCSDAGGLRGMLSWDEDRGERPPPDQLRACAGAGSILTLTVDPTDGGQRWQGIVPLEGDSPAEAVAAYFERSEQLPTRFHLAMSKSRGAGLMLQRMPDRPTDGEDWNRLQQLFATASRDEILDLDGETLMRRLFHEESRRLFPPRELAFHCPCSRDRVSEVLVSLGEEELRQMAAEPEPTEVRCQFCNQRYRFDRLDLTALLHGEAPQIGPTVH